MSGSNGATVSSVNNRVSGLSKARDSRDGDEYARRTGRNRRRRGSSEDVSKHLRQKEGKASPLRHSKDDSDAIDLAPSHFPPLPTSPLALFKLQSSKDVPESKEPSSPTEKTIISVVPVSNEVDTAVIQNETPPTVTIEKAKIPEAKSNPSLTDDVQSLVLSYAQVTQKTASKHSAATTNSNNNLTKSPTK
ncbi:hypothetical protein OS493_016789 [Desmophyllum pertusum]|uniref:Uncharacterized protein n=1 Tax=Desmophyllum pertusum TaxID=174260 RepID=A0A9W9Z358_9CNID|nr:hypothetical protein OS493_016789 [Desmophyllum pertusum]